MSNLSVSLPSPKIAETAGRILFAADDSFVEPVKRLGYTITEAIDGPDAWLQVTRQPYDVLVVGADLHGLSRADLLKRMRGQNDLRDLPVIYIQDKADRNDIADAVRAGAFWVLTKGADSQSIQSTLAAAIERKRRQTTLMQEIVKRRSGIQFLTRGEYRVRTPHEAESVAVLLAGMFPKPDNAMSGLYELLVNAIEHGNLGIGYEFKNHLLAKGQWQDEVRRRLALPENRRKIAILQIAKSDEQIDVVIADGGQGFDWRPFLEIEPGRATFGAGRGIARANLLGFDKLEYIGSGNQVRATTLIPAEPAKS